MSEVPPIPVAVLGSCVTRDVFNSRFNPDYRDVFTCVALHNQGSLISLAAPPVEVDESMVGDVTPYVQREIIANFRRSFLTDLPRLRPEYVLVDLFGDARFGVSRLHGGLVTRNDWKVRKSAFWSEQWVSDLMPDDAGYFDAWTEAAGLVVERIRAAVPGVRIILHDAQFVTKVRAADGSIGGLEHSGGYPEFNARWSRLNEYFAQHLADDVICVRTDDTMSFASHPWGPYGVHYEFDYHRDFLTALTRMALRDARARSH